ncbi:MAG: hypothetical protein G01um101438_281 [Parcubacteria group bacterium Gr01-1014_38]|nr:MAG: hypothetical protein G01um101438_281 [Parcubacteria group bacterium Gr01-1014_38]
MTNRSSPSSGLLPNLDRVDQDALLRELYNGKQELESLLRKLEEEQCPISSMPAAQCAPCAEKDPLHYPQGVTRKIRTVVQKLLQQIERVASLLATGRS